MEEKKKKESNEKEKEEVCETFILEKEGKRKEVESCGEIKKPGEEELEKQNKQLKIILFIIGGVLIIFILGYFVFTSMRTFEYGGIEFQKLNEKGVVFYHAVFPIQMTGNMLTNFNVFLRKDPRKLEDKVEFDGNIFLSDLMVLNTHGNFNCEGDGVIAIANFKQILEAFGTEIITDPNATCDEFKRYVLINIYEGEETKIVENERACYDFYVSDCEILDVTERYLLEVLKTRVN